MISIIIPLHNAARFIQKTVQSCLEQDYNDIEIIIVENGSSDNSWDKLQSINDKRIRAFQITGANAAIARNFGFKKSKGSFVMFLDADDLLSKNKITRQITLLKKYPDGYISSCPWIKFWDNPDDSAVKLQPVWSIKDPISWLTTSWTGGGMMVPACWMVPRQIIDKAGLWNEKLNLHDDGEFFCRVLLASKGNIFCDNTLVYYRQTKTSLSKNNNTFKAAKSALEVYQAYKKEILVHDDSKETHVALAHNFASFLYQYYPNHKSLCNIAWNELKKLDVNKKLMIGSSNFQKLEKLFGLKTSLYVTAVIRRLVIKVKTSLNY